MRWAGSRRISYECGQVLPTNAGASAYVLLAWLPDSAVQEVLRSVKLEAFTERTLTDRKSILARLAETRERGFAVSRGELDRGWPRDGSAGGKLVVVP